MHTPISRTKPLWLALILLVLFTLLLVACGGTQTQSQPTPAATSAPTATDTPTPAATDTPTPAATTAPTTAPTQATQVQIVTANGQYAFQPATITVKKGAQITWTNMSSAPHTVTSDNNAFTASNTLNTNDTFKMVFATPGTYTYHCAIHSYMTATITVTA